jgi:hypothetical protein
MNDWKMYISGPKALALKATAGRKDQGSGWGSGYGYGDNYGKILGDGRGYGKDFGIIFSGGSGYGDGAIYGDGDGWSRTLWER